MVVAWSQSPNGPPPLPKPKNDVEKVLSPLPGEVIPLILSFPGSESVHGERDSGMGAGAGGGGGVLGLLNVVLPGFICTHALRADQAKRRVVYFPTAMAGTGLGLAVVAILNAEVRCFGFQVSGFGFWVLGV